MDNSQKPVGSQPNSSDKASSAKTTGTTPTKAKTQSKPPASSIAKYIHKSRHRFARDRGGSLYFYKDGHYVPEGELILKKLVKQVMNKWGEAHRWSNHLASEVIHYVRADARFLWEQPSVDIINVKNGLLNAATGQLEPHTPNHLSPIQIAVRYDPKATCPETEKFVVRVFPSGAVDLAWDIYGHLMVPDTSMQTSFLLSGDGGNGKSTWLAALTAFLGRENISTI